MDSNKTQYNQYKELIGLLYKMNNRQLGQFLTLLSVRNILFFSSKFFTLPEAQKYLNPIFINLGHNCIALFSTLDNGVLDGTRALVRARDLDLDRALDLALDLARDCARARAFDRSRARDLARDLVLARDLARDRDRDRDRDLARDRETLLRMAKAILENNLSDLPKCFKGLENRVEALTSHLHNINASYWADWFEELFKKIFKISEERKKELFSLNNTQFELTISQTSALLLEIRESIKSFRETRLILLGDKGVGKTTFARRFKVLDAQPPSSKDSTPGVDFHTVKASEIASQYAEENDHTINIWDFAGHTVTHAAHKFFLSESAVYVIILRGRSENGTTLNEWFEHIKYYTGKSAEKIKIYILINKSDNHPPQVDYDSKYAEQFDIEKAVYIDLLKDNAENGTLDIFRKSLVEYIVGSTDYRKIPGRILDIKEEIGKKFNNEFLTPKAEITKIIKNHMPDAHVDDILHLLHSYGICFYYDKLKGDDEEEVKTEDIVLNPRWVTYVIYRLINFINNDQSTNQSRRDGHIYVREYAEAFSEQTMCKNCDDCQEDDIQLYPKIFVSETRYPFISALALTFRLAYKREDLLIFPHCLSENYPYGERGFDTDLEKDFYVEITTSTYPGTTSPLTFPKDIIPAFIVERHTNLVMLKKTNDRGETAHCSKTGAVLFVKNGKRVVKAEVKKTEPSRIVILVKGNDEFACKFGIELVADVNKVIRRYNAFREDEPKVKIHFKDKRGRNQDSLIEEILEEDSLVKELVVESTWKKLKHNASQIFNILLGILPLEISISPVDFRVKLGK